MSGVEAVASACVRKGALAKAGCGLEVYLYTVDSFDPEDEELIYSQATVDTLRAQLEAAHAEVARLAEIETVNEMFRTFVIGEGAYERFCALQARAEAAEANAARYEWLREEAARFKGHDLFGSLVVSVTRLQRRSDNNGFTGLAVTPIGAEFDAEIDAAMARTKEETK